MHPRNAGYQPGNYWTVCDRCGMDFRIDEMRTTWEGLLVCADDWEPRHPQEYVRAVADQVAPDGEVRPPPAQDTFIQVSYTITHPGIPDGTFNNGDIDPIIPQDQPSPSDIENDLIANLDEDLLFTDASDNNLDWEQ